MDKSGGKAKKIRERPNDAQGWAEESKDAQRETEKQKDKEKAVRMPKDGQKNVLGAQKDIRMQRKA